MDNTGTNIRYIEEIPPSYRRVFQQYPCFNTVQSSVLDDAFQTDNSLVVSAPTGSGKTAIFEMAIVRLLMVNENTGLIPNIKMIYISPIKALCRERLIDWHKKFSDYGIKCISLTSDTSDVDARNISQYNLIISTPEKWDVVTRRWRDNQTLVAAISLFMIDEVHLLNADSRGPTLEVIVSRMKTAEGFLMLKQDKPRIRFIALSATIPNVSDIAEWLGPTKTTKYFKFSEDVRPVKLDKVVYGFTLTSQSPFKFDLSLNYKLPNLIYKHSKGKPTLIFCSTRKIVEMTTKHLVSNLQIRLSQEQKEILNQIAGQINDAKLKQFIVHGIALHHAGLVTENRNIIESSFRQGNLPILVTTSTLAMGVNLPAHLVIIKGTKRYIANEGFKDYDEVSIFQMIGRAGRSQFDTSATALILTSNQDKKKYEQMLNCTQNIESNLHKHLTEHLNAEIVLKTITDLEVAMNWLSSTFLYVRAKKCPEKYKLPAGLSKEKIDKKLLEICQIDLNKLVRAGMIKMNEAIEVAPTIVGEIMAKYYIAFTTMELFTKISGNEIIIQILVLLSKCYEFSEIHLRMNDKKCLNLLNKNSTKESIRFPLTGKIKTVDMKINCIMQAVLGNLDISDQSILNDSVRVMRSCERLANCLIEYLETRTKSFTALLNTTILAKCFKVKLWENSPYVSKQLTGVGQVISTLLAKAGKTTFKEIINTNPRHIEMIVGRKAPFGSTIVDEALHLPAYQISLQKCDKEVQLVISLLNPGNVEEKPTVNLSSKMTLLVGDSDNNVLLYEKYAHSYMLDHPTVTRSISMENQSLVFVTANFISEDWVGVDCHFKLEVVPKPIDITNLPTNTKQNNKQTFMDMYMQTVKKGTINKQVKPISKKKTPRSIEIQDVLIGTQGSTTNRNEITKESLVASKDVDAGIIGEDKNIKIPVVVAGSLNVDQFNKDNNSDGFSSTHKINTNCLEPIELKGTQKIPNSIKKTPNPKRKKILISKSIFRTKSKSNQSKILEKDKSKRSENTESDSQFNMSIKKRNISLLQKSGNINKPEGTKDNNAKNLTNFKGSLSEELCPSQINVSKRNKSLLKTRGITNNTTVEDENSSYKYQKNDLKNKTLLNVSKLKTHKENGVEKIASEDIFSGESQMNAAMDAFEIKNDILQTKILESDNEESRSSHNINILKNSYSISSSKNNIDKVCKLQRPDVNSEIINNTMRNEYILMDDNYDNRNPLDNGNSGKPFSVESQRKIANNNRKKMKRNKSENLKNILNTSLSNFLNHLGDDECDNNKKKENHQNQSFYTNMSVKGEDGKKVDTLNEQSPSFVNPSKNNTFFTKFHDKEDNIRSSQERLSFKNNNFIEETCELAALYETYNPKIQSKNQSKQKYDEKLRKNDKNTDENHESDIKVTMDYSDSISMQGLFQPCFLTPRPKRQRELEDYPSPFEESQAKRIKWRSPLVQSPQEISSQYSKPRMQFCFDVGDEGSSGVDDTKESNDLRVGTQDTSSSSVNLNISINSQKHSINQASSNTRKKFPLCDQDYNIKKDDSFENKLKYLEDMCDLESFGLVKKQAISQIDTVKNSFLPSSSAGEYYSQLISSQCKNLRKGTEAVEKTKNTNGFAPFESTLTLSQKLPPPPIPNANSVDPNFLMQYSKNYHYAKPPETSIDNQSISDEQQCNMQNYDSQIPNEFRPNHHYRNVEKNVNYINDTDAGHREIPVQRISANDDYGFVNLPTSHGELHPRHLGNYSRFTMQPSPYFGYHQQPYPDAIMYQPQEIRLPHSIPSRYLPSTSLSYPIPRYANIDPYFKGPYTSFEVEPNWMPMEHINNANAINMPTYHSQVGTGPEEYIEQCSQHGNKNQKSPMNSFKSTNYFEPNPTSIGDNNNNYSNVVSQSKLRERENPQLTHHNGNNFIFEQPCSRSTMFNSQSQSDNNLHMSTSKTYSENNKKFASLYKNNISQLFSPSPKRLLQHSPNLNMSQSHKHSLPKTPYQQGVIPSRPLHHSTSFNMSQSQKPNLPKTSYQQQMMPSRPLEHSPNLNTSQSYNHSLPKTPYQQQVMPSRPLQHSPNLNTPQSHKNSLPKTPYQQQVMPSRPLQHSPNLNTPQSHKNSLPKTPYQQQVMPSRPLQHSPNLNTSQSHKHSLPKTPYQQQVMPSRPLQHSPNLNTSQSHKNNLPKTPYQQQVMPSRPLQHSPNLNTSQSHKHSLPKTPYQQQVMPSRPLQHSPNLNTSQSHKHSLSKTPYQQQVMPSRPLQHSTSLNNNMSQSQKLNLPKTSYQQLVMPSRPLQHSSNLNTSQSHKHSLPKTPYHHLVMPSSQERLLNFNSFEERLDNAILSRNQGFILSATREQQCDSRSNYSTAFHQPNDKEDVMNRFFFSNGRN